MKVTSYSLGSTSNQVIFNYTKKLKINISDLKIQIALQIIKFPVKPKIERISRTMQLHSGTSPYAMIQHSEALQMSPDRELISSLGKSERIRNPQLSPSPSFSSCFQMSFPFQYSLGKTSPTGKAMQSFGQLDSLSEIQLVLQDRMRTTKFFSGIHYLSSYGNTQLFFLKLCFPGDRRPSLMLCI